MLVCLLLGWASPLLAAGRELHTFPTGPIYDFRWRLLALALAHGQPVGEACRLTPYAEAVTQNRSVLLVQSGALDVIALGTNADREARLLPIRIDLLRGIIGYRVFLIRATDQGHIARMDDARMRRELSLGLVRDWADLPIMVAGGFAVETAARFENLLPMLASGRFDALPRGLNEAALDLGAWRERYPQLALEQTRAVYYPYPVYFWVSRRNAALAGTIERGLRLALADGSFRKLFESYYAKEIALMRGTRRHVLFLPNPALPAGTAEPDTGWWWQR
jgi:hypothetical protein